MSRILVTGGRGYIGSVISDLALSEGHSVRVLDALWFKNAPGKACTDNPDYEFIKGDLRDNDILERALKGIDYVVHAAAIVGEPAAKKFPESTRAINYDASRKLIDKAHEAGVKGIVFFSTCSNYGIADGTATEESALNPLGLYAETKVDVEKYLLERQGRPDWVICRFSTVYGISPRMRFDLTVNDFTLNAYTNKYLDIFMPYTHRPYVHVYDAAGVVVNIIKRFSEVKNEVFNVGFNGENYQKIQIAKETEKRISDVCIELVEGGADTRDYKVDFSKLADRLGIKMTRRVADGVKEVADLLSSGAIKNPKDEKYYNTTPDAENMK